MRRAALFGGTFDPVHHAHLALAQAALAALALDEVRWVPAGRPWQKTRAVTPAVHREAMLRLALAGEPRFVLDRIEIERAGPSCTLDTVIALRAAFPDTDWVLLLGQDQYAGLHTWRGWRELLGLVTLAVARRPAAPQTVNAEVARSGHRVVPLPMLDISATDIRGRVAAGADIATLVPPEVAGYIARHGLYRSPAGS
ncbi:MAG: putative nicotinate-nucleotide adenylyltransferase [Pseudomonadota bacterium]|nr:nicotinate (nicotinamide) nucleotide adenylyltransferase [Rubrivivax sp.]NLZ42363.1 nicotinate (nicotinamide) nucleotide adenylyltransferase [Comamonadaceae bacterium]